MQTSNALAGGRSLNRTMLTRQPLSVRAQSAATLEAPVATKSATMLPTVAPLFTPFKMGRFELAHRMVYPPLTRQRAIERVPIPLMGQYYAQRATAGGLMISEGTYVSQTAIGYPGAPGVWTQEQVEAWKPVVQAVHDKGAIFFTQLWHCGRSSHPDLTGGRAPVSASALRLAGEVDLGNGKTDVHPVPVALDLAGIKATVNDYRTAARNAIDAGFDGVELHGANGYLIDQFTKSSTNKRTDDYGGSIENRCRFALEVVAAVVEEIGADRVGIRLSPFTEFQDATDETPYGTYIYLVEQLNQYHLSYLHMIEARVNGIFSVENPTGSLEPFRKVFNGPFITAGSFKAETGAEAVQSGHADLVAYGRDWIANPDLPTRFQQGAPLNKYDRNTFYAPGPKGYTDYPYLDNHSA